MSTTARRLTVAVVALLVLLVVVGVTRVAQVHADTWEWRLVPSAAPPRIQLEGRHYLRGSAGVRLDPQWTVAGHTEGGAAIYVGERVPGAAPTVVDIVDGGTVWGYALSGGP